ncbi:MAG: MFS transporter [Acidobacteria bacterium]|nr:MFS transporter [Acidobacteriota bacterium]
MVSPLESQSPMTRVRWWILALIFFATTVNYLDRIVLSVLLPVIRQELDISPLLFGKITAAFQAAYTIGFLIAGKFIDRYGTRIGYAVSIAWWSVAACFHAIVRTPFELGAWRAVLGIGEAGNFPAAIKGLSEWFPLKDRALAAGIFNSGTTLASIAGPPLFFWMNAEFGWRASFWITGASGFLWLIVWWVSYRLPRHHPGVNPAELAYIHSDTVSQESEPSIGWSAALRHRETWGFGLAKFLTDPVWWFYLNWLPTYFYDVRHFDLKAISWALPVIYGLAAAGSVAGGWLSGYLIRRGATAGRARQIGMAVFAFAMPAAAAAALVSDPIVAVGLICIATAGHQGWSANLYTVVSDVFPRSAVASVTGIGGAMGGFGGILFSALIPGYVVQNFGYTPVFLTMGTFHVIAYFVVRRLLGSMRRIEVARG